MPHNEDLMICDEKVRLYRWYLEEKGGPITLMLSFFRKATLIPWQCKKTAKDIIKQMHLFI
jgi:hypothetical protein